MSDTKDPGGELKRLSPWAILHFSAGAIRQLLNSGLALVPVFIGVYSAGDYAYVVASGIAIGLGMVAVAVLRYVNFRYQVVGDRVQIRAGVVKKTSLDIPFHRVQNVNIIHPFYFRPIGLVSVKVDTAGSSGDEVVLAALDDVAALGLREQILQQVGGRAREETPASSSMDDDLINTRSVGDLVLHGLSSNKALIVLGVVFAAYGQANQAIDAYLTALAGSLGIEVPVLAELGVMAAVAAVFAFLVLGVLLMALLSVLGAIVTYYDYYLYATSDGLRAQHGLFTRHETNLKRKRIQLVSWQQNFLGRVFGRFNLQLAQISHGPARNPGQNRDNKLVVPAVLPDEAKSLTLHAIAETQDFTIAPASLDYTGVARAYLARNAGACVALALILGVAFATAGLPSFLFGALFATLLVALFAIWRRWLAWGIAVVGDHVVVRSGLFGLNYAIVALYKLQQVHTVTTPLMRRRGVTSLYLSVAAKGLRVPYLSDPVARDIARYALYRLESEPRSWM